MKASCDSLDQVVSIHAQLRSTGALEKISNAGVGTFYGGIRRQAQNVLKVFNCSEVWTCTCHTPKTANLQLVSRSKDKSTKLELSAPTFRPKLDILVTYCDQTFSTQSESEKWWEAALEEKLASEGAAIRETEPNDSKELTGNPLLARGTESPKIASKLKLVFLNERVSHIASVSCKFPIAHRDQERKIEKGKTQGHLRRQDLLRRISFSHVIVRFWNIKC